MSVGSFVPSESNLFGSPVNTVIFPDPGSHSLHPAYTVTEMVIVNNWPWISRID